MTTSKRKKEKRLERHIRNLTKDKEYKEFAWVSGKLIEENHNNNPYSKKYTDELSDRLLNILYDIYNKSEGSNEKFIVSFRNYKKHIIDLILHWSSDCDKNEVYYFFKKVMETYWDEPNNLLNLLKNYGGINLFYRE